MSAQGVRMVWGPLHRGVPGLPGGFHTILLYPDRRARANLDVVVNLLSLYVHLKSGKTAKESLYVMCKSSEDVYLLKQNEKVTESHGKVKLDTVASSASTTAKVAAAIQRGGPFLSGSFTDLA